MGIVNPVSEQESFLRIPRARTGALIGEGGKTKAQLEKELDCKIKVDAEGDVEIKCKDPLALLKARGIVQAIGRGFSAENAELLLADEYLLDVINLQEILGKSERAMARYKARLIGTEGKARKSIEDATETKIAIYGKTVSIIGTHVGVKGARRAISMILSGAPHSAVFIELARMKRREQM